MRLLLSCLTALLALGPAAQARVNVQSSLSESFVLTPGQTVQGKLILGNEDAAPAKARLYLTDYFFQAGGEVKFGTPGGLPRSNAPWVSLPGEVVTVPPGGQLEVPYTIKVPGTLPLPGSYWSVLMVEPLEEDDPLAGARAQPGLSIRQVVRYGVQLITELGGGGRSSVAFDRPDLRRGDDGRFGLAVNLVNDGERAVRPKVYAEVYGADGALLGRVDGADTRLYPGTSTRQQFAFPTLPGGHYQVVVMADGGGQDVFAVRYNFDVPK